MHTGRGYISAGLGRGLIVRGAIKRGSGSVVQSEYGLEVMAEDLRNGRRIGARHTIENK